MLSPWLGSNVSALMALKMFIAAALASGLAQAPSNPLPQFEVASVKANTLAERPSNNWKLSPGRIDYHNSQLIELITRAWGDFSLRVEGAPGWITSDRFDIVVQFPADTPQAALTLMMRQLLADRFKLAAHIDMRETAVYSLVLARADRRPGAKLQAGMAECVAPWAGRTTPPPVCGRGVGRGFIDFGSYDMATVARILASMPAIGRPVVDNTGLTGGYRIDLKYTPAAALASEGTAVPAASDDPDAPSIFTALQEQLGLKLESARASMPVLVIDHIEPPAPD